MISNHAVQCTLKQHQCAGKTWNWPPSPYLHTAGHSLGWHRDGWDWLVKSFTQRGSVKQSGRREHVSFWDRSRGARQQERLRRLRLATHVTISRAGTWVSRARTGDCLKLAHSEAVVVDAHTSLHDSGRSQLGRRLCVSFVLLRSNLRTKFSMEIFKPGMQGTNLKQIVHGCVFVLVLLPLQAFGKNVFLDGVSQSAAVNLLSDERRSVSVFLVELLDQAPLLVRLGHRLDVSVQLRQGCLRRIARVCLSGQLPVNKSKHRCHRLDFCVGLWLNKYIC